MKNLPSLYPSRGPAVWSGALLTSLVYLIGMFASTASAVIDNAATQGVWKSKYGVTSTQLGDINWLAADADGDGLSNGSEIASGTNPFVSGSVVRITTITTDGSNVSVTFPTVAGKRYVLQGSTTLTGFASLVPTVANAGTGSALTLTGPMNALKFFRVLVEDVDSDGDGLSDWVELTTDLDPNSPTLADGQADHAFVTAQIALPHKVNINPSETFASEDGPVKGRFIVTRTQKLVPITVNLTTAGTAVADTDYAPALPGSVSFAAGADSIEIEVTPTANPEVEGSESVTATLQASTEPQPAFELGANSSATVIIGDSTVPAGTGLTARYYDHANGTYAHAANFGDAANYAFTRGTPTTTGTIVVTPTTGNLTAILAAVSVGTQVKLTFLGGNLNNALYNNLNYQVTAETASNFTVSITAAAALPTNSSSTANFSIQPIHPAVIQRLDPTVNFDWQHGTPNGVVIAPNNSPENYSATWETYLQPTTAGNYVFQLDADDKARVLLDTGSGLTQILEHGWDGPATVGTFKQSASIPLVVPATPTQRYKLRVEHVETTGDARCRLQWSVNGGAFANIPQANQFTHTQALTNYSYTTGSAVITPNGGHSFIVGDSVTLAFSSGVLFTPGAASTYNGAYAITAVNGTTSYTVGITPFPITVNSAVTTAGSNLITVPSTTGLAVGMAVSGAGLPAGEFITAIGIGTINVTTGAGVTAQASTTLTAVLPAGPVTGNGFVLNNSTSTTTGAYNLCYSNTSFSNSPGRVGVDGNGNNGTVTAQNNGIWLTGTPDVALIQPETFSIRWTGQVQPQFTEDYTFVVQGDDGVALWINDQPQVLKMVPAANTGGSTYTYNATTGDLTVNYAGLAAVANSFVVGETVRIDPSSGNLNHAPTNSPTYNYDPTTGIMVVDYTNLVPPQSGGTRTAGSYVVGETVELDPTSGSLSPLATLPYEITAVAGNTFSINAGTLTFTPSVSISSIATGSSCQITTAVNHGLATGAQVRIAGVSGGTFVPAINNLYTITVTGLNTFTVASNCSAAPTAGTGTLSASGNVTVSDNRNLVITSTPTTTSFVVNIGTGKYTDASTGNMNLDIVNKSLKDWSSNGNERFVRLPMIGGQRNNIRLEYYESNTAARCFLSWYSASQPKQIIPAERLYPSEGVLQPAASMTPTVAEALVGGAFSLPITGSNGASVTVSGLPAWLSYGGGVLTGTPPGGSAGDYQITLTMTGGAVSVVNLHVQDAGGTITRDVWTGETGTAVANIPTGTTPDLTTTLTTLEAPANYGDDYGQRIHGWITAPTTGNYYFWIAASNAAELWISNDAEPVNIFKRAYVTTGTAAQEWAAAGETHQKSAWLALEAGQRYYVEILHKAGVGSDHVAVGWSKPGEPTTAPSQVVPSYVLSPYAAPPPATPGTLYVATMLAQAGAVTSGVGTATVRLSEDENTAIIRIQYSGLSGADQIFSPLKPVAADGTTAADGNPDPTDWHVHVDPYLNLPTAIVYDGVEPTHPNDGPQPDGSHHWTIEAVGVHSKADIIEIIKQGKAYVNLHTTLYTNGEIRGNLTLANGTRTFTPPPAPSAWTDDSNTDTGAVRFLTQASFGANIAEITALKGLAATGAVPAAGIPASRYNTWIDNQFNVVPTPHLPEVLAREIADAFGPFDVRVSFDTWWKTSMTAPDQLRQRIAFALSQIHVVSGQGPLEDNSRAISDFYDTLAAGAFGNFKDVLIGTTLTPAMGRYLDMLRNDKPDLSIGRSPNENYAREIKQLFSVGLYRMWPDGTLMLTSQDSPIDTYTQREIVGLSHVFTGWDYGYDGTYRTGFGAVADWTRPMREIPARHFTGQKRVLNNEVLPGLTNIAGLPLDPYATHTTTHVNDPAYQALPAQENVAVHDMLFNHPNTGPFICRQLIQRMVTSNPSRDYLYRVVQKFNDNGLGVRGDMKAVIKAILLDYEARSPSMVAIPAFGKQREPVMRVANAARAFRPSAVTGTYAQTGTNAITITTSTPHLLVANNNVFLEFTDTTGDPAKPAPTTGTYTVLTTPAPTATTYAINAPGWITGTYSQTAGQTSITVTSTSHWLPTGGSAYIDFLSATTGTLPADGVKTALTSNSTDTPSGVGNVAGTTFTFTAPDTTARTGTLMISRFSGSYSCPTAGGPITIDTAYGGVGTFGAMANHHLAVNDNVFLNFANSRDTTSGNETSTENDLVYPIITVPDPNTFTVLSRTAANAAINSDNQAFIFPQLPQPRTRNGTINTRPSTFVMDNTDTDLQQTPLNSPTVFNFFLPDYKYAGTLASQGITTPEFQLTSETTAIRQANFMYAGVYGSTTLTTGFSSFKTGSNALVMDLTPWMSATAANLGLGAPFTTSSAWTSNANVPTLIDQLNTLLLAGQLPANAKTAIQNFLFRPITGISAAPSNPSVITSVGHGLVTGDSITISGVTGGTFTPTINGTFTVTVPFLNPPTNTLPDPDHFTVASNHSAGATTLTNAYFSSIPYTNTGPTSTMIRDRLRAIVHLILTSPDFTIQR